MRHRLRTALDVAALLLLAGSSAAAAPPLQVRSSPIAASSSRVVAVNPDSASISVIDERGVTEIVTGGRPQTVAIADGNAYVASREGELSVVDLTRAAVIARLQVDRDGYGVAAEPGRLYFTAPGCSRFHVLDRATLQRIAAITTDENPAGIAVDRGRVYVTHLRSGRVSVIDESTLQIERLIETGADSNLALSIVIANDRAYLPHSRSNSTNPNPLFDSMVFPAVSVIDLATQQQLPAARIFLNIADQPVNMPFDAVIASNKLYVVNAGSDDVSVIDLTRRTAAAHVAVGGNPRGAALSPDGTRVYVDNTLSGTVSVIDVATDRVTATIPVTTIRLSPDLLNGKMLFHTSSRPDMAKDRWMSCASCHFEGMADGRTWLMHDGPRNTPALFGAAGTLPGHWSADIIELEDIQNAVRGLLGGTGLAPGDLHDLALYIRALQPPPNSVSVDADAAQRGERLFSEPRTGCASCHPPPLYTDLQMHDVGTGGALEHKGNAFDTPSLRGLQATAPYFHDGSAATLREVLARSVGAHGNVTNLDAAGINDLIAFLQSLPFPAAEPRRRPSAHSSRPTETPPPVSSARTPQATSD